MNLLPWGTLAAIALAAVLVFTGLGGFFVIRLLRRPTLLISDEIQSSATVLRKVRSDEPMNEEEIALARQVTSDRASPLAFCIPAALFSIGCFFVLGSLEQLHGAAPSERTFLGVFPMLTATNFTIQLLKSARLRRRLPSSH
jgi:hypothetical protein